MAGPVPTSLSFQGDSTLPAPFSSADVSLNKATAAKPQVKHAASKKKTPAKPITPAAAAPAANSPPPMSALSLPGSQDIDGMDSGATFTPKQTGGTTTPGTATQQADGWLLKEGDSFETSLSRPITIPTTPGNLSFKYSGLSFDTTSANKIKDAFEVALIGANGQPLTPVIVSGRDAFFNATDGEAAGLAAGVTLTDTTSSSGTVTLDMSALTPGTQGKLVFKLVNNDGDHNSQVKLLFPVAPSNLTLIGAASVAEGASYTLNLSVDGTPPAFTTWTINWGDTTQTVSRSAGNPNPDQITHIYADGPGLYSISAAANSTVPLASVNTVAVSVTNVAPTASLTNSGPVGEGSAASVTFASQVDPSTADTTAGFKYSYDFNNDGTFDVGNGTYAGGVTSASASVPSTYLSDGPANPIIHARIIDRDGGFTDYTSSLIVNNVAPSATFTNGGQVNEGSPASVLFSGQSDPSAGDVTAGFRYSYDFNNDGTFEIGNGTYVGGVTAPSATVPATYLSDGPALPVVRARVIDRDGGFADYFTTITVNNVAPAPTITGAPASGPEGTAIPLTGSYTDPGGAGDAPYTVAWSVTKDGGAFSGGSGASFSFTPNDNGSYVVMLTVTDKDGGAGSTSKTISVTNVAPTATLANGGAVNEGSAGSVTLSAQADPSTVDAASLHYSYDFNNDGTFDSGDGTYAGGLASATAMVPATYLADGPGSRVVRARVIDKDGGFHDYTTTITINNVAPAPTISGAPTSSAEGTAIAMTGSANDPGTLDTPFTYAWSVTKNGVSYATGSTSSFSFTPNDNATYVVTLNVTDKDSAVGTTTKTITGTNVNPIVTAASAGYMKPGQPWTVQVATFTDPGTLDTHTATINWGDGTGNQTGAVSESAGSGSVSGAHTYTTAGNYTVTVTVIDKDAGATSATFTMHVETPSGQVYRVPGTPNTNTTLTFNNTLDVLNNNYADEMGLFLVDDLSGTVNGLAPGATNGWWRTAMTRTVSGAAAQSIIVPANTTPPFQTTKTLLGGTLFSLYLVKQHTLAYALTQDTNANALPTLTAPQVPITFAFDVANISPQHQQQWTYLPDGRMRWEMEDPDTDVNVDFDDNIGTITAGTAPTYAGAQKFYVADPEVSDADTTRSSIFAYDQGGAWVDKWGVFNGNGPKFPNPTGIASNAAATLSARRVWTIDAAGNVQVMTMTNPDTNGPFDPRLTQWVAKSTTGTSAGTLVGVTVEQSITNHPIWMLDAAGKRILQYNSKDGDTVSGNQNAAWATALPTSGTTPSLPTTVSDIVTGVDASGNRLFYITDSGSNSTDADRIWVYKLTGTSTLTYMRSWVLDAANTNSSGVALNPASGNDLWVSDRSGKVYHYASGRTQVSSSTAIAATDSFQLAVNDTDPEGIADPPTDAIAPSAIDFSQLSDVSSAMGVTYHRTSLNDMQGVLYSDMTITNSDTRSVRAPLVMAVKNISQPGVGVQGADGITPDGAPYFIINPIGGADFAHNQSLASTIKFYDPNGTPFTYQLVFLAHLNTAPHFTSDALGGLRGQAYPVDLTTVPGANRILEIISKNGNTLSYNATGADPENDAITFSKIDGPDALTVNSTTGAISWTPTTADVGISKVRIRVTDQFGAFDPATDQIFSIRVRTNVANRPPRFITDPTVVAYVGNTYSYDSNAFDPDGDTLTFQYVPDPTPANNPGGNFALNSSTGVVTWTPTADQVGKTYAVKLTVTDPAGTSDEQNYQLLVQADPANHPPVIVSTPPTSFNLPAVSGTATGSPTPTGIALNLAPGQTADVPVQLTLPSGLASGFTPPTVPAKVMTVTNEPSASQLAATLIGTGGGGITILSSSLDAPPIDTQDTPNKMTSGVFVNNDGPYGLQPYGIVLSTGNAAVYGSGPNNFSESTWSYPLNQSGLGYTGNLSDIIPGTTNSLQSLLTPIEAGYPNYDATALTVSFQMQPGFNTLYFNLAFGSDEYPDYTKQQFIDAFGMYLDGTNIAKVSKDDGGTLLPINIAHPRMHAFAGTELNGMLIYGDMDPSPNIPFSQPVGPGVHTLTFIIADTSDGRFDSTVYISSLGGTEVSEDADLTATDSTFTNLTGDLKNKHPGDVASFAAHFTGDGQAHNYSLNFVDKTTGQLLGTIPVTINSAYQYKAVAIDPDNDPVSYHLIGDAHGATLDSQTGMMSWQPAAAGTYNFQILAADGRGGQDTQSFTVTVGVGGAGASNLHFTSSAPTSGTVGDVYSYRATAADDNNTPLNYYLVSGPAPLLGIMSIDRFSGILSWSPASAIADQPVTIEVSDGRGATVTQTFHIAVNAARAGGNGPPVITWNPASTAASIGEEFAATVTATDPDGDPLKFDLPQSPVGMVIDPSTGELRWTPGGDQAGINTVTVRALDGQGGSATKTFQFVVSDPSGAPIITSLPQIPGALNHAWSYQVTAVSPSGNSVLYGIDAASTALGMSINPLSGLLTWTPTAVADYAVTVTVTGGTGLTSKQNFTLPVVPFNTPPFITSHPTGPVLLGQAWTYQVTARDFDDASGLTFSINDAAKQRGMSINATTGLLSWTPLTLGSAGAVITVTDPHGASGQQPFTMTVLPSAGANQPPQITSSPAGPAMIDRPWQYLVQAADPEGDALTLSVTGFKDSTGATISPASGDYTVTHPAPGQMLIQWTPRDATGSLPVHFDITAADSGHVATQSFDLAVIGNAPPIIVSGPTLAGAQVGAAGTYSYGVIDYNGDPLTFQLVDVNGQPLSAAFSPASIASASTNPAVPSTLSVTYTPAASGTQQVRLRVSDGEVTVEQPLKLIVQAAGSAQPSVSLSARSVIAAGENFVAQVVASDPQNDVLTYSLQFFSGDPNNPAPTGMTIDSRTGQINWTPTTAQITADPTKPYKYSVTVTDGATPVTLGPIALTVVERLINQVPVIVSDPTGLHASASRPLIYNASATDADKDVLTWSIIQGPSSARIDPATGQFTWLPTAAEIGQNESARIQVSDPFGASAFQDVPLQAATDFVPLNAPPRIDTTPPLPGNGGETYSYLVHATDPDAERITFTLEDYAGTSGDGTAGITINRVDDNTALVQWVSPAANASRDLVVRATDERGASVGQRLVLTIAATPGGTTIDTPPAIISTPAYSVPASTTYRYPVMAQDPDGAVNYSVAGWNAGGTSVSFLSIGSSTGILTGSTSTPGVYTFEVRATQNGVSAIQRYNLVVTDPASSNTAPVIQPPAGALQATVGQQLGYQVIASDPDGDPISYWFVDANGGLATTASDMSIANSGQVTWAVPTGATSRSFTVRAIDSRGAYSEQGYSITIGADQAPTISFQPSNAAPAPGSVIGFTVAAADDIGLTDLHVTLSTSWAGTVTLLVDASNHATYQIPSNAAGLSFTATATAVDTAGHTVTTAPQTIQVTAVDTAAPIVAFTNVGEGAMIQQATDIRGRAYDPDGNLVYYSLTATPTGTGSIPITLVEAGTLDGTTTISPLGSASTDAFLATINPLSLANGSYTFQLFAEDSTGKVRTTSFNATIQTTGKLGDYSLGFTDLHTAVGNVPVTISRTYSSQRANQNGDFGFGWTLGVKKGQLQIDVPPGDDPLLKGLGFRKAYQNGTRITLTLPDGSTRGFTTVLIPDTDGYSGSGSLVGLANLYLVAFLPDVDSRDTSLQIETHQYHPFNVSAGSGLPQNLGLPDSLAQTAFQSTLVAYNPDTNELRDPLGGGGTPFNPATYGWKFRVAQTDGTSYEFDSSTGELLNQVDRQGNAITYTNNGDNIKSVDQAGVTLAQVVITRTNGLITQVNWDDGDSTTNDTLSYTYDANGDLKTFTDRNNVITSFTYNTLFTLQGGVWTESGSLGRPHFLTRVTDQTRGVATVTAIFDPVTNRLSGLVDASGASIGIGYTTTLPNGQTAETLQDPFGNFTEVVRDARGNLARQIQQVGVDQYLVTVHQYDAQDNETAVSKPTQVPGAQKYTWVPDPATGYMNHTVYGDSKNPNLPTSTTDGNGVTTTYTYDTRGNLTQSTDPLGTTTNAYDGATGQLLKSVDRAGHASTYGYDARGNLYAVQQIKNDGTKSTAVTSHFNVFDELDSITDAAGRMSGIEYDHRGNRTALTYFGSDGKQVRNETTYDSENRMTGMRQLVDGIVMGTTSMTYDSGGKVLTTTDEFGHTTTTLYDVRENPVQMRSPAKDENGNDVVVVSDMAYDAMGREIAHSDPYLVNATSGTDVLITPAADLRVSYTRLDAGGRVIESRRVGGIRIAVSHVSGGTAPDYFGGLFTSTFNYDAVANTYPGATPVILSSNSTHYDGIGQVDSTTSETGLVTSYQYDGDGRQTQMSYIVNGVTSQTTTAYDADGNQVRTTDAAGRVTDFIYDALGQLRTTIRRGFVAAGVIPGSGADNTTDDITTQAVHDELGRTTADIDALGRRTDYQYDTGGRLIAVTLPYVDADGTATGTINKLRPRYEYHYDVNGKQSAIISNIYSDESSSQVVYLTRDLNGADASTTRAASADFTTWPTDKGDVTAFTYDNEGRQLTRTLPLGVQTTGTSADFVETNVYDTGPGATHGQLLYSIDLSGRVTAYDYENTITGGGRVKAVRYYNTFAQYQADPSGTAAARKVSSTYDAFGRVKVVTESAFSTPTTYTYDGDGSITQMDSAQGTIHYAYDTLGRKVATWTGSGATLTDARTQATTLTEYGYDTLSRLTRTTAVRRFGANVDVDPVASGVQPESTTTVFNADGQINYELIAVAGGAVTEKDTYDSQGRIQKIDDFNDANSNHALDTGETLLSEEAYTYNADDTRASETDTDQAGHTTTTNWTYDGESRVAKETLNGFDDAGNAVAYTDSFQYDMASNRTLLTHTDQTPGGTPGSDGPSSVTTSKYDGNDRLLSETTDSVDNSKDTFTAYAYGSGNATSDQTASTTYQGLTAGGTVTSQTSYTYDAVGHMTGASITNGSGTTSVSYAYDAGGVRVEQTVGTTRTVYLVDPANPTGYTQVLEEGIDANNNHKLDAAEVQKAYTLGMKVLAQATATQVLHLLTDAHGNTKAVLNIAAGPVVAAILQRFAYTAYGSDLGLTTPLTAVRYAGQMIDPLTGLSFNRARWYNPADGRFFQSDPFGGDSQDPITFNKYLYGNGIPVRNSDPTGNESLAELMVATTGGEAIDNEQNGVKTAKAAIQAVKMIVRISLLIMEVEILKLSLSNNIPGGIGASAFSFGYYLYEWRGFEDRLTSTAEEAKVIKFEPNLVKYLAKLPEGIAFLEEMSQTTKTLGRKFLSPIKKGKIARLVLMPLTGRRSTDDSLAAAVGDGEQIVKLIQTMRDGKVSEAADALKNLVQGLSPYDSDLTWHHSEIMGVMEEIGFENNKRNGHVGSAAFWGWIHGLDEYPK